MSESGPIILYEPDPGLVDLLREHLEHDGTKVTGVSTPGEKSATHHEIQVEKSEVTLYTSCVMSVAYSSADIPHLQFCANRLARGMSKPTAQHWYRLKRAARFVKTHGRWILDPAERNR